MQGERQKQNHETELISHTSEEPLGEPCVDPAIRGEHVQTAEEERKM